MSLKLKCTDRFRRCFNKGGRTFNAYYERWTIVDSDGAFVEHWDITERSNLSLFLTNLLGHKESYPIDESRCKIFETVFQHTNRWKLFQDARSILNKKGSRQALKFLEDKFAVIRLSDKLEG